MPPDPLHPTDFQAEARRRARLAADWLVRSIDACGGAGSSAFYSRVYNPVSGWAPPYPETTGYIIPTLIEYARHSGEPRYDEIAMRQAEWIRSLQYDDGALPGGDVRDGRRGERSIFNTGQMILGLVAAGDRGDEASLDAARRAARWLAGVVDDRAGTWTRFAYRAGFNPAYYTRVTWPMLEVWSRTGDTEIHDAAVGVLDTIASWQQPNGAIRNWAFTAGAPAFTHTIAYTIRGFWESARLLDAEGDRYRDVAHRAAEAFRRLLERRGRLAGAYDLALRGDYWYTCLTGNCQMALVFMRCADSAGDLRYLSAALKALAPVIAKQSRGRTDPDTRGAIAGSSPIFGRYLFMRYPNWATKFLLDALIEADMKVGALASRAGTARREAALALA